MSPIHSFWQTVLENFPWNKPRINVVTRFLLALYAMQTVYLAVLSTAFSETAKEESNYKRRQRFMRNVEKPYDLIAHFVVKVFGVSGLYTLALDRNNWKVGAVDLNTLMPSIRTQYFVSISD